ncbi:hypothetical protein HW561_04745 [Rhodobacteraceae bacterium B1Z28]|uniref:Uncharacterized protein n=1 Tax=Ruegeria haliotis TaxID=2747601 RepID=A0ABX2PM44_9RHOB|nr:hypothetical protein [Ruegeria haliotis]NVO55098.1 hypothetical protein [Ruegeria haliotis]
MSYNPESMLTYQSTTQSITEWALDYGIPLATIIKRLNDGWPVGCAIGEPIAVEPGEKLRDRLIIAAIRKLTEVKSKKKLGSTVRLTFRGEERSLNEWATITGIQKATLRYRLNQGWSVARTLNEPVSKNSRNRPGVVSNFGASEGTGVGTSAQDRVKITFSEREAS